ncbi:MAG TPA: GNAT family N-acetyltransferase [Micromonosporaceae bacterium]|jgi:L-amino acid N-acyltransferase YncA
MVRDATDSDWPAIWAFQRGIVAAGDTFAWDTDTSEASARSMWMRVPPDGRTFVAVDEDGTVIGTAEMGPNHGGPASHIANAGFMVDPAKGGRGAGRALVEHVIASARADGYRGIKFNAVAETNKHAVKLYQECGFDIIATVPEGFRHPSEGYVGLHIMYRTL